LAKGKKFERNLNRWKYLTSQNDSFTPGKVCTDVKWLTHHLSDFDFHAVLFWFCFDSCRVPQQFGMLDTSAPVWDISAPGQFGTCVFFFDFTYKTSNSLDSDVLICFLDFTRFTRNWIWNPIINRYYFNNFLISNFW
jgi:hypothetical protein